MQKWLHVIHVFRRGIRYDKLHYAQAVRMIPFTA